MRGEVNETLVTTCEKYLDTQSSPSECHLPRHEQSQFIQKVTINIFSRPRPSSEPVWHSVWWVGPSQFWLSHCQSLIRQLSIRHTKYVFHKLSPVRPPLNCPVLPLDSISPKISPLFDGVVECSMCWEISPIICIGGNLPRPGEKWLRIAWWELRLGQHETRQKNNEILLHEMFNWQMINKAGNQLL